MVATFPEKCQGTGNKEGHVKICGTKGISSMFMGYGACIQWTAAQPFKMGQSNKYNTGRYDV